MFAFEIKKALESKVVSAVNFALYNFLEEVKSNSLDNFAQRQAIFIDISSVYLNERTEKLIRRTLNEDHKIDPEAIVEIKASSDQFPKLMIILDLTKLI